MRACVRNPPAGKLFCHAHDVSVLVVVVGEEAKGKNGCRACIPAPSVGVYPGSLTEIASNR